MFDDADDSEKLEISVPIVEIDERESVDSLLCLVLKLALLKERSTTRKYRGRVSLTNWSPRPELQHHRRA